MTMKQAAIYSITMEKIGVEVISSEIVKPSTPTPSLHKFFTLSFLDQISPPLHTPLLLFYTNSIPPLPASLRRVDTNALKKSLSETLSHFYQLAGQVVDGRHLVSCNDQGIPFIETRVNCDLSTFLNSPCKLKVLHKFFPSKYYQSFCRRPISEVVQLAFQINVFKCGGFALGCYMFHKLLDAASIANFLKYWSILANEHYKGELMEPDFHTPVITFPPSTKVEPVSAIGMEKSTFLRLFPPAEDEIVMKNFRFNRGGIEKLKCRATSKELRKPTGFEAVSGFIWEHAFNAACAAGSVPLELDTPTPTWLSFPVDIRGKTNPPLPKGSMGNLLKHVLVRVDEKGLAFPDRVAKIHAEISMVEPKIESFMGIVATCEASPEEWFDDGGTILYKAGSYKLSSWCNLGFNEVDFGFGKPNWIVPTDGKITPIQRNFSFLTDYRDPCGEYGIEVWMYLVQKEMFILESNPHFLAYASPH